MLRTLVRLIVVVVIIVGLGAFFLGYRWASDDGDPGIERPVGTTSLPAIDTSRARETGAAIGERVAEGASDAQRALAQAGVTAKIKSKMALDDTIKAANINVDTDGSVVTLTGRVSSEAERTRALQLARETEGVTSVVDRITVAR
jgi:hyperosmotically inducible protein